MLDLPTVVSWVLMEQELAAALIFALAVSLTAFGVPGPLSVLSSPALGPLASAIVIVAGLAVGSQAMFLFVRRLGRERIRSLAGPRFDKIVMECDKRGMLFDRSPCSWGSARAGHRRKGSYVNVPAEIRHRDRRRLCSGSAALDPPARTALT